MPPTAPTPGREDDRDQPPAWIALASMFAGQRLDRRAAIGAYVAVAAIFAASVTILLLTR